MTRLLSATQGDVLAAANLLRQGEIVAFPTETVYGLGACVFDTSAIAKLYAVKGRPKDNPLIAHLGDLSQIHQITRDLPSIFWKLAEAFFPGPLTIVLPKHPSVPASVCAGLHTIGVRFPAHPVARALIQAVGMPLVAPSANLSGLPSSTQAAHVLQDFQGKIAAILDGGACELGIESTVILLGESPRLLRLGALPQERVEAVLGCPLIPPSLQGPCLSPGMKYRHYAPQARVRLLFEEQEPMASIPILREITPANLYTHLRAIDVEGHEEVWILCSEEMQRNAPLMDRLNRAAHA